MLRKILHLLAGRRYHRLFWALGLLAAAYGLTGLARSAMFVHEAVRLPARVVDVRQQPFESITDALRGGDYSAETAYFPQVHFTLPNGVSYPNWRLPDADAQDYTIGDEVTIITMPLDPTTARLDAWKFIWGEPTVLTLGGFFLILIGQLLRGHSARGKRTARPTREAAPQPARERKPARKGQMELGLDVENETPAPKPKRRRKNSTEGESKPTRKRKKKDA